MPKRSIRSAKYKLLANLLPDSVYKENHLTERDHYDYWKSCVIKAETDAHAAWAVKRFQHRPAIDFYDLEKDPLELRNLADQPEYADEIKAMRDRLDAWMKSQGDTGVATDR